MVMALMVVRHVKSLRYISVKVPFRTSEERNPIQGETD